MIRVPSLLFAALLLSSAAAFAADTPDPSSTGGAGVPTGANANEPATPPAGSEMKADKNGANAAATTPSEENKGKPPASPQ
jgi:hypothetical protein